MSIRPSRFDRLELLQVHRATLAACTPAALLTAVLAELKIQDQLYRFEGFAAVRARWRALACGIGERVRVTLPNELQVEGYFRDLDENGALITRPALSSQTDSFGGFISSDGYIATEAGGTVAMQVAVATDMDHWTKGDQSGEAPDIVPSPSEFNYQWKCPTGLFIEYDGLPANSTEVFALRVQWKAPGTWPSRSSSRGSRMSTSTVSWRPCSLTASAALIVSMRAFASPTIAFTPRVMC